MKGIEAALTGVICGEIELKESRNGNPYLNASLAVDVGSDDGKPQWVRVAVFGENAERIAMTVKKGDKLYCEGSLTLTQWNDAHGEVRHGLNLAAWKAMKIGASAIGKNREKRRVEPEQRQSRHVEPRAKALFKPDLLPTQHKPASAAEWQKRDGVRNVAL